MDPKYLALPAGSEVIVGRPRIPIAPMVSTAIEALVDSTAGIQEAHLPMCFAAGLMEAPALVLVVDIAPTADLRTVLDKIGPGIVRILPPGQSLDVWPLPPDSSLLPAVRNANCRIGSTSRSQQSPL